MFSLISTFTYKAKKRPKLIWFDFQIVTYIFNSLCSQRWNVFTIFRNITPEPHRLAFSHQIYLLKLAFANCRYKLEHWYKYNRTIL